jgi:hypothetical protein
MPLDLVIGQRELTTLAQFQCSIGTSEIGRFPGVQLTATGDGFVWAMKAPWTESVIDSEGTVLSDEPESVDMRAAVWIPPAAIWLAATIADREGTCTLTIADKTVAVRGQDVSGLFDLPTAPPIEPRLGLAEATAVARVDLAWLTALLRLATSTPLGAPTGSDPDVCLAINSGGLFVTYDLTGAGGGRSTVMIAGDHDQSAMVRVNARRLRDAIAAAEGLTDVIDIGIPCHPTEPLAVQGPQWITRITPSGLTGQPWTPSLAQALQGYDVSQLAGETLEISLDGAAATGRVVTAADRTETLHLRTAVGSARSASIELFTAMNAVSRELAEVRLMWDDGTVYAAREVPAHQYIDLPRALASLWSQGATARTVLFETEGSGDRL